MLHSYLKPNNNNKLQVQETWRFLKRNWELLPTILFFFIVYFYTKSYAAENKNYSDTLIKLSDKLVNASSILAAILITFLVGKVIQLRQEKLAHFPEYFELTQKIHFFRNALYILFKSNSFWVNNLKQYMDKVYEDLEYYDVRKVVFVNSTKTSELAHAFHDDETYGDTIRLYLALKAFFPEKGLFDPTLYIEFNVEKFYNPQLIELWGTFEPSAELHYFFNYKYGFFEEDFNFQNVSARDQRRAVEYAHKVDNERYKEIEFGNTLYDMLGQQFTEDILPRLSKKSQHIHEQLPLSIQYLIPILSLILAFGVVVPIFNSLYNFNMSYAIVSISIVLSVVFYFIIALRRVLQGEMRVSA